MAKKSKEVIQTVIAKGFKPDGDAVWDSPLLMKEAVNEEYASRIESEEQAAFDSIGSEIIPPPYDPRVWTSSMDMSTRLTRCVWTLARNTVGLGWKVVPTEGFDPEESGDQERARYKEESSVLRRLLNRPNAEVSFPDLMERIIIDREAAGIGWLEVVRDIEGKIVRLYHAPTRSMRILKKGRGYVQVLALRKVYFKKFGDKRVISSRTGDEGEVPLEERATEIIPFKIYSPNSLDYGAPRYVAAAPAISGNRLSAIRNVVFFENDAVPRLVITVSGGHLAPRSFAMIKRFLTVKGKGAGNAHRVLLLQGDTRQLGIPGAGDKININITPLTVGVQDDASFQSYRRGNDEEIREAFGITEAFFKTMDVNRAAAIIGRKITNEQIFQPERNSIEYQFNQTVVHDVLGEQPYDEDGGQDMFIDAGVLAWVKFKAPDPMDLLEVAEVQRLLASVWATTPDETRKVMGLPPFPDDFDFSSIPYPLVQLLLENSLVASPVGAVLEPAFRPDGESVEPPVPSVAPDGGEPPPKQGAPVDEEEKALASGRKMARDLRVLLKRAGVSATVKVKKPTSDPVSFDRDIGGF